MKRTTIASPSRRVSDSKVNPRAKPRRTNSAVNATNSSDLHRHSTESEYSLPEGSATTRNNHRVTLLQRLAEEVKNNTNNNTQPWNVKLSYVRAVLEPSDDQEIIKKTQVRMLCRLLCPDITFLYINGLTTKTLTLSHVRDLLKMNKHVILEEDFELLSQHEVERRRKIKEQEEERIRVEQEEVERRRKIKEKEEQIKKEKEEQIKKEQEEVERRRRIKEEQIKKEQEEVERRRRIKEEQIKKEQEEQIKKEQEEVERRRRIKEEQLKKEEEERIKKEQEEEVERRRRIKEEQMKKEEEERIKKEQEEVERRRRIKEKEEQLKKEQEEIERRQRIIKEKEEQTKKDVSKLQDDPSVVEDLKEFHGSHTLVRIDLVLRRIQLSKNVEFSPGESIILPQANALIKEIASAMVLLESLCARVGVDRFEFNIDGHVDDSSTPTSEATMKLSQDRSHAVTQRLVDLRVSRSTLHPRWFGGTHRLQFGDCKRVEVLMYQGTEGQSVWVN